MLCSQFFFYFIQEGDDSKFGSMMTRGLKATTDLFDLKQVKNFEAKVLPSSFPLP